MDQLTDPFIEIISKHTLIVSHCIVSQYALGIAYYTVLLKPHIDWLIDFINFWRQDFSNAMNQTNKQLIVKYIAAVIYYKNESNL